MNKDCIKKAETKHFREKTKMPDLTARRGNKLSVYHGEAQMCGRLHKKCLCCGKIYPSDTRLKSSDFREHGYLYADGYLYQRKGGRCDWEK